MISLIAAMAKNRVIGIDNHLPWHLSADLKRFRTITLGKPIIMGRKTFESIGKPLPDRHNIIVTQNQQYRVPGCTTVSSLEDALQAAGKADEIICIGGATLYHQMLPLAQRLYLTYVQAEVAGDVLFPEINSSDWREAEREEHEADAKNQYPYCFVTLDRITQ